MVVAPTDTATVIFETPGSFTGALNLFNPQSHVNLFFKGQTPTGATFDSDTKSLIITGASGQIDKIPFGSNGISLFATPASTLSGFGEVSITALSPPASLALSPASDSGAKGDNITNVNKPTVSGTGENGATVTLVDGLTAIGTAIVAGGAWSIIAATALAEGDHSFTANQRDVAGNSSLASLALDFIVDTVAPSAPSTPDLLAASDSGISKTDNITNVVRPTFSGTGENDATVTLRDGITTIGTGTVSGGAWSITATTALSKGANAVTATQTDVAGNISAPSAALNVTVDTTAPAVTAVTASPADAVLGAGAPVTLTLGFSEAVTVAGGTPTLRLNNGGTATYASGSGTSALTFDYSVGVGQDVPLIWRQRVPA